ncbi:cytochrome P450 [Armillaria novae-zelandiae]|uniref:Cytochrome P450 n=1 Tax=Armillaria novae-zelandiae TaxID=153914 RepID=A0AA39TB63_9AGAR|nr:cytochrome P450 [Armillaria novae-zelandiae]
MVLFPDAQEKAHAQLNDVLQGQRLPTRQDRDKLPYVNAQCKEVMRFHPPVPLGVPRRTAQDDVYNDYLTPKDSIIPNIKKMTRDPAVYEDPEAFNPSRFLPESGRVPERDPRSIIFGFGRRSAIPILLVLVACTQFSLPGNVPTGQYLADEMVFIIVQQS